MNRKQRRTDKKKVDATDSMSAKVSQFQSLPDHCLACQKPFDKKSKKMAMTWNVVVRDEDTVRLYCPDCWKTANSIIEDWKKKKEFESGAEE